MATAESVKAKLQNLLTLANGTTGNTDATLTAAVNALIAGFGQGGGGSGGGGGDIMLGNRKLLYGQFTPTATGGFTIGIDGLNHETEKIVFGAVWIDDYSVVKSKYNTANIMVESHNFQTGNNKLIHYFTNGTESLQLKTAFGLYIAQSGMYYESHSNWPGQPETYNWIALVEEK